MTSHQAAPGRAEHTAPVSAEVTAAEASVARADLAFSASLHDASLAGRDTAKRVVGVVRPVLIGIGIVGGLVLAVRLIGRPKRSRVLRRGAAQDSVFWDLGRSAALAFAGVAGQRLALRWLGPSLPMAPPGPAPVLSRTRSAP